MKNDRKDKIPVVFLGKLFQYDKTKKILERSRKL